MNTTLFIITTNGRLQWRVHHTLSDLTLEQWQESAPVRDDRPILEGAMHAVTILLGYATVVARGLACGGLPAGSLAAQARTTSRGLRASGDA